MSLDDSIVFLGVAVGLVALAFGLCAGLCSLVRSYAILRRPLTSADRLPAGFADGGAMSGVSVPRIVLVQTQAENEEAGCKYGFTASGETPHCNTQEEGQRDQEAFRREREDPQREAENEQAGTEVRSHEECVVQLGVNAC